MRREFCSSRWGSSGAAASADFRVMTGRLRASTELTRVILGKGIASTCLPANWGVGVLEPQFSIDALGEVLQC